MTTVPRNELPTEQEQGDDEEDGDQSAVGGDEEDDVAGDKENDGEGDEEDDDGEDDDEEDDDEEDDDGEDDDGEDDDGEDDDGEDDDEEDEVGGDENRFLFFPPKVEGFVTIDMQNDFNFDPNDREKDAKEDSDVNDFSASVELEADIFLARPLFINVDMVLVSGIASDLGTRETKRETNLLVDALSFNWLEDRWSMIGGKFVPNFSIAYAAAPGIYGSEFAEMDIELSDRIGFGGDVTFPTERYGTHTLSGSTFWIDTTILSGSFIRAAPFARNVNGTNQDDGGPSNTGSPDSFAAAIDGGEFKDLPGFRYQIAGAYQKVNLVLDDEGEPLPKSEIDDEYRFAIAAEWEVDVNDNVTVTPLLEYVHFWNGGGIKEEDRDYLTLSTAIEYNNWNLAISSTARFITDPGNQTETDAFVQVSGGYTFDSGLGADIGYRLIDEGDIRSYTIGLYIFYSFDFET